MATRLNFRVSGALTAALIVPGMARDFIDMAVIFPWLDQTSWHAYGDLIERD